MVSNSTKLTMGARYIIFILLLLLGNKSKTQETANYVEFEDQQGIIQGQQIKSSPDNFIKITSPYGYLRIRRTDKFRKTNGLSLSVYFLENGKRKIYNDLVESSQLYLNPGDECFIDISQINTNKLIKRYTVQRPILFPKLKFQKLDQQFVFTSKENNLGGEFYLSPDENLNIEVVQRKNLDSLDVEYSLRNLKANTAQQGTEIYTINDLKFEANTDYELRVNYRLQRESTAVIYIHIKPHWYQSPMTYFILLVIFMGIGIFLITLTFKRKIKTSQKEQQQLEQAAIRLQSLLNPHFTFNALSSIQGLMNTGRIDEANLYLQEFSSLLRQTLAKSQQVFNNLDQELETMGLYLKLEAFRFNFTWEIEVAKEINVATIEIPTLLLQPLIENAIKHGLAGKEGNGQLLISCKADVKKDTFIIVIKDNGTWLTKSDDSGYGLTLTKERIKTINKMNKEQQIVLEFNKQDGTEVILTFHNWINN